MNFFLCTAGSAAPVGSHPDVRLLSAADDLRLSHRLHVGRGESTGISNELMMRSNTIEIND